MPSTVSSPPCRYRGRFAPSPTGPLHFGSLVAALASCLDARAAGGEWLLRIEDVDAPRNVAGAAEGIVATLAAFGFAWDGEVVWQSRRLDLYRERLDGLRRQGRAYPCGCSRREIAEGATGANRATSAAWATSPSVDGGLVYPGTCRAGLPPGRSPRAWRLTVPDAVFGFDDRIQGRIEQNLAREVGDFVLLRADGQYAYQLAVVVDDAEQGVTDIVRGADLIDSTPRQLWLQQCLGVPTPRYAHLPVAANAAGEKLSKQTRAPAVSPAAGVTLLAAALRFLGQVVPAEVDRFALREFWEWAIAHWNLSAVPRRRSVEVA